MKTLNWKEFTFVEKEGFKLFYDCYNPKKNQYITGEHFTTDITDAMLWEELLKRNGYNVIVQVCRSDAKLWTKDFTQIKDGDALYKLCRDAHHCY